MVELGEGRRELQFAGQCQCVSQYTIHRVSAAEREFPLSVQSRSSTDLGGSGLSPHVHFLTRRKFESVVRERERGEKHRRRART